MGSSFANHFNVSFIESMYRQFQEDPNQLEPTWRYFFEGMAFAGHPGGVSPTADHDPRIPGLIRAYRKWGHLAANLDPLGFLERDFSQLELSLFGFSEEDLEKTLPTGGFLDVPKAPLKELIGALERTYCGHVGVEFLDGSDVTTEEWFQQRLEPNFNQPELSLETKRSILNRLNEAELFEAFLHTKYVGQKRFSLEGAEPLIPCLAEFIDHFAEHGCEEIVLGMSHRGRLNVLANIMGKNYEEMFSEFEPNYSPDMVQGDGDVKYHKGFVSEVEARNGQIMKVSLADNPSHLEAVCPVVEGVVRANQSLRGDFERRKIVPILIHGDASFSGQGIVSETLNMSQLNGFKTGGTIHIIINNQIGFTTEPREGRSTLYCSDVARQILAPVFHVNCNDPEALVHVVRIATEFRQQFNRDIVIDLLCYRKYGHNEGDEPSFTQPVMYSQIRKLKSLRSRYVATLISQGELEAKAAKELEGEFQERLQNALVEARSGRVASTLPATGEHFNPFRLISDEEIFRPVETAVDRDILVQVSEVMTAIPDGFKANRKIKRLYDQRRLQVSNGEKIDWGTGETLAYGSLIAQGLPCRLTGQDVRRGTFSHRHAALFDAETGEVLIPLKKFAHERNTKFSLHNSHLSELAVLGFEFGYSLAKPKCLVIWEAQFGDFANGAQIIVDQFLSSSESKWNRVSDLVMFLPHGYEGQGPEHSSARLERYLQLCAENNIQVANLTSPAQLFHALRRQLLRGFHKPLILMTPKSLLRHPQCVSTIEDFTIGRFNEILADPAAMPRAKRLVLCSGKVYYDLAKHREQVGAEHVAILRVEQLYPLALSQIATFASGYPDLEEVAWVQEEPKNMGAWSFIAPQLEALFERKLTYIGRPAAASPAVGSLYLHQKEQEAIVAQTFA